MENKEELATKLLNVSLKAINDKELNLEEKSVVCKAETFIKFFFM